MGIKYYNDCSPMLVSLPEVPLTFAGIGSRETPIEYQQKLADICYQLGIKYNARLYSGNANGSDFACQSGMHYAIKDSQGKLKISNNIVWLPKPSFNYGEVETLEALYINSKKLPNYKKAVELAKQLHPIGNKLSGFALEAHARNTFQVLGYEHNEPVDFVLCYTHDGAEHCESILGDHPITKDTGGTATAIRLASLNGIPVFNIKNPGAIKRLHQFLISKGLVKE